MKASYICEFSIGRLIIMEEDGAITRIELAEQQSGDNDGWETPLIKSAAAQLREYFSGRRRQFDLPLAPKGTPFQKKVWAALCEIPYGETRTYGQIAEKVGNPKASRAVGMANHNNPIMIVIPCHRVIGANGSLTGYAGGLSVKQQLLDLEQEK